MKTGNIVILATNALFSLTREQHIEPMTYQHMVIKHEEHMRTHSVLGHSIKYQHYTYKTDQGNKTLLSIEIVIGKWSLKKLDHSV